MTNAADQNTRRWTFEARRDGHRHATITCRARSIDAALARARHQRPDLADAELVVTALEAGHT